MRTPNLSRPFDAVVLGLGGVGSAALMALSSRGGRVLGIDAHGPAHHLGSSWGFTRVFRHAYFEHPGYVPLLQRATSLFEAWETHTRTPLLHRAGVLLVGPPDSVLVHASRAAAEQHGLQTHWLSSTLLARRFPQFAVHADTVGLFEPDAGFVRVEDAIRAALEQANAPRLHHTRVAHWERLGTDHLRVHLADGRAIRTRRLAIAAGAWTPKLVPSLAPLLTVSRNVQTWLNPLQPGVANAQHLPGWLVDRPGKRALYGIPADPLRPGPPLTKVAVHGSDTLVDADTVSRAVTKADRKAIQDGVDAVIPGIRGPIVDAAVCMYTNTPDEDFIVDTLPDAPEVAVVTGLSGHGFKLAPVLGQALADLVADGHSALPIDFLRLQRFR